MKRIIIAFLLLVLVVPLVAQEGGESQESFNSGYRGIVEVGWIPEYQGFYNSITIKYGYHLNPYFSMGVGISSFFDLYPDTEFRLPIPVFADFRVNFMNRKISPYFSFNIGTQLQEKSIADIWPEERFSLFNDYKFGIFLAGALGSDYHITEKMCLNLGISIYLNTKRILVADAPSPYRIGVGAVPILQTGVSFKF